MINLIKFRKLKKQHELKDFELVFIALLNGGVELALTEGPESALNKSINREYMEEDVKDTLDILTERMREMLQMVLLEDKPLKQVGKEFCVSEERVRSILERGFDRVSRRYQPILIGASRRNAQEELEAQVRQDIQVHLRRQVIERIKMQQEQRQKELSYKLEQDLEVLCLPPTCLRKLRELGLTTIGSLLENFPYNMETNELEHFLCYPGSRLNKADYFDVWSALYEWGLLVRIPVLPDCLLSEEEKAELKWQNGLETKSAVALLESRGPFDDDRVDALELSVRSYNCLVHSGIKSYQGLREWCEKREVQSMDEFKSNLMKIWSLGRKSMEEVLVVMKEHGWLDFLEG